MGYCLVIDFQEGIIYHKCLGFMFLICSFGHYMIFIVLLFKDNHIPYISIPWNYHSANFTISLMFAVLMFVIIPIFCIIACFEYFRRNHFEIFYYLHLYGAQVLIISILFHAHNAWYYLLPSLILQMFERLYRLYNGTQIAQIINLEHISNVITKLEIVIPHKYSFASGKWSAMNNHPSVKLCQYVFINIPNISMLQWHPFSISNPLHHSSTVFFIKNMNRGWTQSLNKMASKLRSIEHLNVAIEGPYGITLDFENYQHIVLVAGGVGITPLHNIFMTLYEQIVNSKNVRIPSFELWWINKTAEAFSYYIDSFRTFQNNPVQSIKIKLLATREKKRHSVSSQASGSRSAQSRISHGIEWNAQRPYLPTALSFMERYQEKGLIYVCGPKSMVDDCVQAAYNNGNHIKREYFLW